MTKKGSGTYWICQCSCGNIKSVSGSNLRNGRSTSCGCHKADTSAKRMRQYNNNHRENIIGNKYGLLTVLELTQQRSSAGCVLYKCQCECGNIHYATSANLKHGNVQSCGCSNSIIASKIKNLLLENNIDFKTEYTFSDLYSPNTNVKLRFDFAIFKNNQLSHLIEYDGQTHYKYTNSGWNTKENYEKTIRNDQLKNQYCKQHNIKLIRISYLNKNNITLKKLIEV